MPRKRAKTGTKQRTSKGKWVRWKKSEQIIEKFEEEDKKIDKRDLGKHTELVKEILEDVFQSNPRQYLNVSMAIVDTEVKYAIAARIKQDRTGKGTAMPIKAEFENIKNALKEKEILEEKIKSWYTGEAKKNKYKDTTYHPTVLIKELRKRDKQILGNMKNIADKIDTARRWRVEQIAREEQFKHYV